MPITEQKPLQGIEQGSLFPSESYRPPALALGMIVQLSGPKKEAEVWVKDWKEFNSLSRSTDPITSKLAGEKTKEFRARHISKIWGCLKENGPKTYKEIALLIGMEPVAVARRRKEMEENQLIEVLEETRNGCALWRAK